MRVSEQSGERSSQVDDVCGGQEPAPLSARRSVSYYRQSPTYAALLPPSPACQGPQGATRGGWHCEGVLTVGVPRRPNVAGRSPRRGFTQFRCACTGAATHSRAATLGRWRRDSHRPDLGICGAALHLQVRRKTRRRHGYVSKLARTFEPSPLDRWCRFQGRTLNQTVLACAIGHRQRNELASSHAPFGFLCLCAPCVFFTRFCPVSGGRVCSLGGKEPWRPLGG